jgi:hypothetical protein
MLDKATAHQSQEQAKVGENQNARAAFGQVYGHGVKVALILEGIDDGGRNGEGGSKAIKEDTM